MVHHGDLLRVIRWKPRSTPVYKNPFEVCSSVFIRLEPREWAWFTENMGHQFKKMLSFGKIWTMYGLCKSNCEQCNWRTKLNKSIWHNSFDGAFFLSVLLLVVVVVVVFCDFFLRLGYQHVTSNLHSIFTKIFMNYFNSVSKLSF